MTSDPVDDLTVGLTVQHVYLQDREDNPEAALSMQQDASALPFWPEDLENLELLLFSPCWKADRAAVYHWRTEAATAATGIGTLGRKKKTRRKEMTFSLDVFI